jgi:hypothetical protein
VRAAWNPVFGRRRRPGDSGPPGGPVVRVVTLTAGGTFGTGGAA